MKYKISYLVAPLFFILSLNVSAEYKTTGFTDEEYQKVAKSSGEYRAVSYTHLTLPPSDLV